MNPAEVINTTLLPLLWENNLLLNESKSLEIQEEEVVETTTATTSIILVLSSLAFVLSPLTVASNLLVIVPFCRLTRVRTPSNQILLALAIIDGLLGFLLFLSSISGKSDVITRTMSDFHDFGLTWKCQKIFLCGCTITSKTKINVVWNFFYTLGTLRAPSIRKNFKQCWF